MAKSHIMIGFYVLFFLFTLFWFVNVGMSPHKDLKYCITSIHMLIKLQFQNYEIRCNQTFLWKSRAFDFHRSDGFWWQMERASSLLITGNLWGGAGRRKGKEDGLVLSCNTGASCLFYDPAHTEWANQWSWALKMFKNGEKCNTRNSNEETRNKPNLSWIPDPSHL